jgi:hypothetical protein
MAVNWKRGFFRLWLVIALLWLIPVGVVVAKQLIKDLLVPATLEASERAANESCKQPREIDPLEGLICKFEEEVYGKSGSLRVHPAAYVSLMLAIVLLPPLVLLLPGMVVAWIVRGFVRIST